MVLEQVADHDDPVLVARQVGELHGLVNLEDHRLLHVNVLVREQGLLRKFVVRRTGGRNDDCLYVIITEYLIKRVRGPGTRIQLADLVKPLRIEIAYVAEIGFRNLIIISCQVFSPAPHTYDGNLNHDLCDSSYSSLRVLLQ